MKAAIQCAAAYVPAREVTNDDLSRLVDTTDEWIATRTGIRRRRVSTGENTSDMAFAVCEQIFAKSGLKPADIDLLIVATVTADYATPSVACMVQGRLGAENAIAFDVNAACTGFLYALSIAEKYIAAGACRNAIIVGAETLSKQVDWTERSTCVLFGDGAGGVLLTQAARGGILGESIRADGRQFTAIRGGHRPAVSPFAAEEQKEAFLQMDGRALFDFTTREVPKSIRGLLEKAGIDAADVSFFLLHQANERIVSAIAKKLGIEYTRFPININDKGNTSSASVPILLAELADSGKITFGSGERLVLAAFGGGLTWGSMIIQI